MKLVLDGGIGESELLVSGGFHLVLVVDGDAGKAELRFFIF